MPILHFELRKRCEASRAERRKERVRSSQVWTNGSCRNRTGHNNSNGNNKHDSQSANGCITNRGAQSLQRGPLAHSRHHMTSFDSEQPLTIEQVGFY
ncbi:hypothetical protein COOONC_22606 [Cooperia oncophora]